MIVDGLTLLILLIGAIVGLIVVVQQPPRYRCATCAETFSDFPALCDHEAGHRPKRSCWCRAGEVHHPSCPTRGSVAQRAAA